MYRFLIISLFLAFLAFSSFGNHPNGNDHKKMIPEEKPCIGNPYMSTDYISAYLDSLDLEVPMHYDPRIFGFIDYFVNRDPEYTQMVIYRSSKYFPYLEKTFAEANTPDELKYLAIVESGLNPQAKSRMGAGGLWQFMPYTGKQFGLKIDLLIDDRFDPYASTKAASTYLLQLKEMLGAWDLAIAAYNCGPGNVRRAIRRSGYKRDFWEIYRRLPRETRSYLPQFVAIYYIFNHIEELGFNREHAEYMPTFQEISVSQNVDLEVFAEGIDVCLDDLEAINPQIKKKLIPIQRKNYTFRIPTDAFQTYAENKDSILARAAVMSSTQKHLIANYDRTSTYGKEKHVYKVRSGDVLGLIAQRYHVRVSDIKKWNNLRSNTIRVGQRLAIWKAPGYKINEATATPTQPIDIPAGKVHVVRNGDTLWDISRMYKGLSIQRIKELNNLKTNTIKPGQKLRIG